MIVCGLLRKMVILVTTLPLESIQNRAWHFSFADVTLLCSEHSDGSHVTSEICPV